MLVLLACLAVVRASAPEPQITPMAIAKRQDEETSSSDSEESSTTTTTEEKSSTSSSSDDEEETSSSKPTKSSSKDDDEDDDGKKTKTKSKTTSVDPRLGPGAASLTEPPATSTTYYKIGDKVTFGWNYTSLIIEPSAIDVLATCTLNDAMYTIASNMSFAKSSVVWDTEKFAASGTAPLLTATYTLIIKEAGTEIDDIAKAGHLAPMQHPFGMYKPQPYTPLDEYVCATCNSAMSDKERQAIGFVLTMAAIVVTSFTLFASGFGVFS